MAEKRINMKDIAKEAGVSVATVSYIVNKRKDQSIAPETIERVQDAITRLGYVPNLSARALVANRSHLFGVVIPQTEPGKKFMFANPFYGEFLSSVEYEARMAGYHVLISGTNVDQSYLEVAQTRSLDGIIIVGMYPEAYYEDLKRLAIPVILVDSYCEDLAFHTVSIDDRLGGRLATEYLLAKGHRRIGFASGVIKEKGVNYERYLGYREALQQAQVPFDPALVYSGTVGYEYGLQLGEELGKDSHAPTALFASADILAVGLIRGLKKTGKEVPEDLSVIGFDDSWIAENCDPALTTIRQNVSQKGAKAAHLIIEERKGSYGEKQKVVLPVTLVERSSVREL